MTNPPLQHGETMPIPVKPFGRVVRVVAGYGVATALLLIPPFMVFAPASIFDCAMRNGRRAAWAAGVLAIVLLGICLYVVPVSTVAEPGKVNMAYATFLGIALSIAVPSIFAVPLVERLEKFGTVLVFVLFFSALGLGLSEFIMRSAAGFSPYAAEVQEQTQIIAQNISNVSAAISSQGTYGRLWLWLVQRTPELFPAGVLVEIAIFFILSLMMVGRLSAWRSFATTRVADSAMRRAYLFRNFAWPEWLLFVFVAAGVTPLLTGFPQQIAGNALALMVSLYILQGLAVFRFMLAKAGAGYIGGAIGFFLLGMLCTALIGFLLLALAGLFDPFFDFRHLKRKDDSHESHTD